MDIPKNRNRLSEAQIDHVTRLFQGSYALVVEAACRYAPMSEQSEDMIQQAYLEFIQGVTEDRWDLEQDVGPLLYQITKRKAQLAWRDYHRNQGHASMDAVMERLVDSYQPDEGETLQRKNAKIESLKHCLDQLSAGSRAMVEQHYFGGVKMNELARQHGKNTSAIYNFFFQVRAKLRDCIEKGLQRDEYE